MARFLRTVQWATRHGGALSIRDRIQQQLGPVKPAFRIAQSRPAVTHDRVHPAPYRRCARAWKICTASDVLASRATARSGARPPSAVASTTHAVLRCSSAETPSPRPHARLACFRCIRAHTRCCAHAELVGSAPRMRAVRASTASLCSRTTHRRRLSHALGASTAPADSNVHTNLLQEHRAKRERGWRQRLAAWGVELEVLPLTQQSSTA